MKNNIITLLKDKMKKKEVPVEKTEESEEILKEENKNNEENEAEDKESENQEEQEENLTNEQYNKQLNKNQQELKEAIATNHDCIPEEEQISQMLSRIRADLEDIVAILITSKTFDELFIMQDVRKFIELVQKMELSIDFTYLFVLYNDKPTPDYYGVDEYPEEVKVLFDDIGKALLDRKIKTYDDIKNIKNINIFHKIFIDFL